MSVSDCFEISRLVCQKFLAGEFDEIRLGFTQFVSMLTQTATVLPVLPFDAQRPEPGHERESLMMYEPDGKTVFDAIIPSISRASSTVPCARALPVSRARAVWRWTPPPRTQAR